MSAAFDLVISRLPDARKNGTGHKACCPGHDDQKASLSISQGELGVVMTCHAGCSTESVVEALGLEMADLFDKKNGSRKSANADKLGEIVAVYDYRSSTEELLYQTVRYRPKDFRQRRPNGKGGWIWNLTGVKRALYRLPELLASGRERVVFKCEGEKDADAVAGLGLVATCNVGGAGKWRDEYNALLFGRRVVILPHNDKAGRDDSQLVARSLYGTAASIKVVELPGLAEHGDAYDWITAGGNRTKLKDLVEAAPEWVPPSPLAGTPDDDGRPRRPCTQLGNAERLIDRHGGDILYCKPWNDWLCWDGRRWAMDATGRVASYGAAVVRSIYGEAAEAESKEERRELSAWARRCESEGQINAMVNLARWMVPALPSRFDTDPWLLNVRNGTLDLRTGELREHRQPDSITKLIDINYDPDAECPRWLAFLERVLPDEDVRRFVQRAIGYSATGSARERCVLIAHGTGKNGKGVLLQTIRTILGEYAVRAPSETFLAKRGESIPNDVAMLRGARFVFASETNEGRRLAEATVKDLTGGEDISARFMRGEWFSFVPTFTPWIATNHRPVIKGSDEAIWDRIKLIPFAVRIPDEEQDPDLVDKLKAEYPGILAWIGRGAAEWYRDGLGRPKAIAEATGGYRAEMDLLGTFIEEHCYLGPTERETAKHLYHAYKDWCEAGGEKPETKTAFGLRLRERGFDTFRGSGGTRYWVGLTLTTSRPGGDGGADDSDTSDGVTRFDPVFGMTSLVNESRVDNPENASQRVTSPNVSLGLNDQNATLLTEERPLLRPRVTCLHCHDEFTPTAGQYVYCSDTCREKDIPE
jgi:putative DNA primase/helicase